jgi:hypothetical protein
MAFLGSDGKLTRFADFNRLATWLEHGPSATRLAAAKPGPKLTGAKLAGTRTAAKPAAAKLTGAKLAGTRRARAADRASRGRIATHD